MGFTEFPSMPPQDPNTPEEDGFPYVRVADDSVILDFGGDKIVELPFRTILKNSMVIKPGNDTMVNLFTLTLITSGISVDDSNAHNERIKVVRENMVCEERAHV